MGIYYADPRQRLLSPNSSAPVGSFYAVTVARTAQAMAKQTLHDHFLLRSGERAPTMASPTVTSPLLAEHVLSFHPGKTGRGPGYTFSLLLDPPALVASDSPLVSTVETDEETSLLQLVVSCLPRRPLSHTNSWENMVLTPRPLMTKPSISTKLGRLYRL